MKLALLVVAIFISFSAFGAGDRKTRKAEPTCYNSIGSMQDSEELHGQNGNVNDSSQSWFESPNSYENQQTPYVETHSNDDISSHSSIFNEDSL